ncbi:Cell wall synthesis protein kre9 precursor [Knufia peltigerae]|uniref:Cell wall synthesis protein kre9 n=1 Tax=Knufia peltigerae TaxID=1002370 RepID=A0AA39CU72_9EURO|nr:Cell wall synthesis protein kre9 precursor [Knufia peltigerae]
MILRSILLVAASLLSFALADVEVTSPAAGASLSGLELTVEWKDSGDTPKLADLASYQLFLCAGGNDADDYIQLATLVTTGDFAKGNSVTATLTAGVGGNVQNAYFLKFISAATGGTVVNFSNRFSLTSMTGTFPAAVTTGLKSVTGTKGPATQNNIQSAQNPAAGAGGADAAPANGNSVYSVPYTLQTGTIRYAPMPPRAPTKITAKAASPQWPTSAYTVYKSNVGTPNAVTTHTEVLTFSVSSREATVAAAAQPTDAALQKFLNRWKD